MDNRKIRMLIELLETVHKVLSESRHKKDRALGEIALGYAGLLEEELAVESEINA